MAWKKARATVCHGAGTAFTGKSAWYRGRSAGGTSDPPADADDGAAPNSRPPLPPPPPEEEAASMEAAFASTRL